MGFIVEVDYFLKNLVLRVLSWLLFPGLGKQKPGRILIFRTGSMGDSICSLPAINALRQAYPEAELEVLTHSGGFRGIALEDMIKPGIVDAFINYENLPRKELISRLKHKKYDLFILFPQAHAPFKRILRDLVFARIINVRKVAGFRICVTRLFPAWQARHKAIPNVRDFLLSISREAGALHSSNMKFPLNIQKEDTTFVNELFDTLSIWDNHKLIAFTIGAKRPQNRWPIDYFQQVTEYMQSVGYTCLIIGGEEDNVLVSGLSLTNPVINLCGRLSVMQSAEVLRRCRMLITNDTGPMHLAYATRTYVTAVFSSRDYPGLWYPPEELSAVFRNNAVECANCFSNVCKDNVCMRGIAPEAVIERVMEELGKRGKSSRLEAGSWKEERDK
ncbi:MAG: glycosyltransferase family 9 protein [Bacteroidales bacterium]|nr:glycosyltransferase family 9 protein [Bacteroidales bacterium]